ncbi:MAG: hypothetical protein L0Z62_44435 [Gemmataceae bacterium]|nr:hypothetical protein [Gemmataceae bacterium]
MIRSKWCGALAGVALGLFACTAPAYGQNKLLKSAATGNPQVKSIQAIGFGPQGLLLVGDGSGSQLVAIDTGDTTPIKWTKTEVPQITEQLAGRLGTTAKGISLTKMAVNPASSRAYFAVRKTDDKSDLILTMDGTGKVNEFRLDNVKHVRIKLPANVKSTLITDVAWADDRVLAAVQAQGKFKSKIVSVLTPLTHGSEGTVFSAETYHVAHKRWETEAPMRTVFPYKLDGKRYLVGAFTCTPIVKYPIDDLVGDAKVKGVTVIENGNGNEPRDMFTYTKNGKTYILLSTLRRSKTPIGPSPYWVVKVDGELLRETTNVNEKALWRVKGNTKPLTDRAVVVEPYHGVVHMDRLDEQRALVIRTDDKGNLTLAALALP